MRGMKELDAGPTTFVLLLSATFDDHPVF